MLAPLMNPVPSKTYGGTSLSDNAGWNHASVKENNNIKYKIELPVADNEVTDTIVVTDVLSIMTMEMRNYIIGRINEELGSFKSTINRNNP